MYVSSPLGNKYPVASIKTPSPFPENARRTEMYILHENLWTHAAIMVVCEFPLLYS